MDPHFGHAIPLGQRILTNQSCADLSSGKSLLSCLTERLFPVWFLRRAALFRTYLGVQFFPCGDLRLDGELQWEADLVAAVIEEFYVADGGQSAFVEVGGVLNIDSLMPMKARGIWSEEMSSRSSSMLSQVWMISLVSAMACFPVILAVSLCNILL